MSPPNRCRGLGPLTDRRSRPRLSLASPSKPREAATRCRCCFSISTHGREQARVTRLGIQFKAANCRADVGVVSGRSIPPAGAESTTADAPTRTGRRARGRGSRGAPTSRLVLLGALIAACVVLLVASLSSCSAQTSRQSHSHAPPQAAHGAGPRAGSRFVSRVNQICRITNEEIVGLPRETTPTGRFLPAAYVYDMHTMLTLAPGWAARLADVHPPARAASRYATFLHVNNEQNAVLAAVVIAARGGQTPVFRALGRRLNHLITLYNGLANSLGLSVCAQNVTPSSARKPPPIAAPSTSAKA